MVAAHAAAKSGALVVIAEKSSCLCQSYYAIIDLLFHAYIFKVDRCDESFIDLNR